MNSSLDTIVKRHPQNPIFTAKDVPYESVIAYTAGVMPQDLEDPLKLIAYSREPLIAPEAPYEISGGFRNNMIFPGGMIIEDNGEVKIYYGAADTVECLATAQLDEWIDFCLSFQ